MTGTGVFSTTSRLIRRFRNADLARPAVTAAEAWLRERGVWKINLMVRSDNEKAGRFYERLGYEVNPVTSFGKRLDGP